MPLAATEALRAHPVLAGLDERSLDEIASSLQPLAFPAGERLMRQGDPPSTFLLLTDGEVSIRRMEAGTERTLARLGPGAVVGELGLLGDQPRSAEVVALTDVRCFAGGPETLNRLVSNPEVRERVVRTATDRAAANVAPVVLRGPVGDRFAFRPLLASDRTAVREGIESLSRQSRYQRFFSAVEVTDALLDRLVDVDYVNHFAWVVSLADEGDEGDEVPAAVARFIRLGSDPTTADLAFTVLDRYQGRGIGSLLLGALAVAANEIGVERFSADVLADNLAMRAVFNHVGVKWEQQGSVVHTVFPVPPSGTCLPAGAAEQLRDAVREVEQVAAPDTPSSPPLSG